MECLSTQMVLCTRDTGWLISTKDEDSSSQRPGILISATGTKTTNMGREITTGQMVPNTKAAGFKVSRRARASELSKMESVTKVASRKTNGTGRVR